jgi:hypothetical protein
MGCIRLASSRTAKETIARVESQPTEWDKVSAVHLTGLISSIYKELKKLKTKRTSNPVNK